MIFEILHSLKMTEDRHYSSVSRRDEQIPLYSEKKKNSSRLLVSSSSEFFN